MATTTPTRPLTARQHAVLDAVRDARPGRGRPAPTPAQIAAATGIPTPEVRAEVAALQAAGWLRTRPSSPTPTPDAPAAATSGPTCPALTPRQREILQLAAEGLGNDEIATQLWLTESTVKTHLARIARALGARPGRATSRTHAVALALRAGVIS